MTISQPRTYQKAIIATVTALLGQLALVLVGDLTPADLTWGQWMVVLGTAVAAFSGTYGITNHEPTPAPTHLSGGTTGDV